MPARQDRDSSRCRLCAAEAVLEAVPGAADGGRTLCSVCCETVADWYVPEFRRWTAMGTELIETGSPVDKLNADPHPTWTTAELRNVKPARFLKQLMTMLVAIAPPGFGTDQHPELAAYALAPGRRGLPARYHMYLSLYRGPLARFVGYSAELDARTGTPTELLEVAYPPFSCVLSLGGHAGIETTNISEFAELGIDEACIVDLDLLDGFGHTPFPADFRTLAAVERDRESERHAA
jgi:hypothetical protein